MMYLGADHGGWPLKERLKRWLTLQGVAVIDETPDRPFVTDDYPTVAARVCQSVRQHANARGILFCRTGVGMAIAANKFPGIRAVQGVTVGIARRSRQEEDTNILTLAADLVSLKDAQQIFTTWSQTRFKAIARYRRRLGQLNRLDHGRNLS